MSLSDLIKKNRSYRRFKESERISPESLKKWIDLARCSASGRNVQPLKYVCCTTEEMNGKIFPHLAWAGYLTNWKGPVEGERPSAYIIMLLDKSITEQHYCDDGIAAQTILLSAVEEGYGGCIVGSVNKAKVSALLGLPDHLQILWVIALGKPAETVVLHELEGNDVKYWRDENGVHHVPKRRLEEIIVSFR